LFFGYWWQIALPKQQDERLYMYGFLNSLNIWMIVLAACGYAKKYLNFTNSFLKTANKAVYPFYIIHQTVIVAVAYYLVQLDLPIAVKLPLLVLISFSLIYGIYYFLIKPFLVTRFLFGMKMEKKKKTKTLDEEVAIDAVI